MAGLAWNILSLRTAEDGDDDGAYPAFGFGDDLIEFKSADGDVMSFVAKALSVSELIDGDWKPLLELDEAHIELFVSDCRVALACEKWTKGGGYRGWGVIGLSAAVVANAVSHARAAGRRKGKLLVGHVRYQWVATVGFLSRSSFPKIEQLRIVCQSSIDGPTRTLALGLTLPKGSDAGLLAQEITQRTARFRLGYGDELADHVRAKLVELSNAAELAGAPDRFVTYSLPPAYKVSLRLAGPSWPGPPTKDGQPATPAVIPPEAAPVWQPQATPPAPTPPAPAAATLAPPTPEVPLFASPAPVEPVVLPPAGWKPDPAKPQLQMRYWDGSAWTGHFALYPPQLPTASPAAETYVGEPVAGPADEVASGALDDTSGWGPGGDGDSLEVAYDTGDWSDEVFERISTALTQRGIGWYVEDDDLIVDKAHESNTDAVILSQTGELPNS